jgi:hypothetical protein
MFMGSGEQSVTALGHALKFFGGIKCCESSCDFAHASMTSNAYAASRGNLLNRRNLLRFSGLVGLRRSVAIADASDRCRSVCQL